MLLTMSNSARRTPSLPTLCPSRAPRHQPPTSRVLHRAPNPHTSHRNQRLPVSQPCNLAHWQHVPYSIHRSQRYIYHPTRVQQFGTHNSHQPPQKPEEEDPHAKGYIAPLSTKAHAAAVEHGAKCDKSKEWAEPLWEELKVGSEQQCESEPDTVHVSVRLNRPPYTHSSC